MSVIGILQKLKMLSNLFRKKVSWNTDKTSIAVHTNKYGNVDELDTKIILSNYPGQYSTRFYFRLEPECKVSYGDYPTFVETIIEHDNEINYTKFQSILQYDLAERCEVDDKYVIPITKEEYDEETAEG